MWGTDIILIVTLEPYSHQSPEEQNITMSFCLSVSINSEPIKSPCGLVVTEFSLDLGYSLCVNVAIIHLYDDV